MNKKDAVDSIIKELEQTGSQIDYVDELRSDALNLTGQYSTVLSALNEVALSIRTETESFLHSKNKDGIQFVSGISTCIYLPDFKNRGEYKIKILGGEQFRDVSLPVNEDTMFDVASITKLFTLILLFKLEELKLLDLDTKVSDINPDFQNLEDFTLMDLIRLHGELRTDGNIRLANNKEEAYEILKTLYLSSNSRLENNYTDFGAIVLSDTVEKVISKYLGKKMTYDEIMKLYLLEPLGLNNSMFNPVSNNISGMGYQSNNVHDPKAMMLGSAVGSAGLFTTSEDLALLAKHLYRINYVDTDLISKINLYRLGEITFPNSKQNNKGNLGIYVKHPQGLARTYTPSEFATGSFSHQGWTGSLATFDMVNGIHQSILVNSIYNDEDKNKVRSDKPVGFSNAFDAYLAQLTKKTMLMYLVKQYYSRLEQNIDISINMPIK